MDDLLMIRFALDNVRPPEIAEGARQALDRLLDARRSPTSAHAMDVGMSG